MHITNVWVPNWSLIYQMIMDEFSWTYGLTSLLFSFFSITTLILRYFFLLRKNRRCSLIDTSQSQNIFPFLLFQLISDSPRFPVLLLHFGHIILYLGSSSAHLLVSSSYSLSLDSMNKWIISAFSISSWSYFLVLHWFCGNCNFRNVYWTAEICMSEWSKPIHWLGKGQMERKSSEWTPLDVSSISLHCISSWSILLIMCSIRSSSLLEGTSYCKNGIRIIRCYLALSTNHP